jgi:ABC-type molybdate transport system substrate-binding protein
MNINHKGTPPTIAHAMRVIYFTFLIIFTLQSCKQATTKKNEPVVSIVPELLIYCENGMVTPILEISNSFETQYKCKVRIQNDCSKNLIGLINYSQKGDLFIPDSYESIAKLSKANPQIITDSLYIGVNQLVFIVKKGNPESFDGSFLSLSNRNHAVLLANPETSSLGFETKKLLEESNVYDPVMINALALSVDSRGIIRSVINGEASVAIDWLSSYHYSADKNSIDTINISVNYEFPKVFASVLKSSENPGLAYSFLATLSSGYGTEVFAKHGIHKRRTTIF